MNETLKRFFSALIAIGLSLGCFYCEFYLFYWIVVTNVCLLEFSQSVHDVSNNNPLHFVFSVISMISYYTFIQNFNIFILVTYFMWLAFISIVLQDPSISVMSVFSVVWIVYPLHVCFLISSKDIESMLVFLTLIWITDAGAYFFGKFLGRTPFFQNISPKKTLEGTVGGIFTSYITRVIISYYFPQYRTPTWIFLTFVASIGGQFGDLFESLIKRSVSVKDSGNVMPGHGGLLDRMDSVFFAVVIGQYFLLYNNVISINNILTIEDLKNYLISLIETDYIGVFGYLYEKFINMIIDI
tara:strand:+ start:163 stop:1056 length:894 start_codon:yes stop_codon:yes gene_type:complete